jgi:hypothetical protein
MKMLRRLGLVLALLTVSLPPADAAERRVALVVGAANYKNAPRLANTINDAKGMAAALERTGFEVEDRDPTRPLVVDPGLVWSTFLGGSGPDFIGPSVVARDGTGDVFVGVELMVGVGVIVRVFVVVAVTF